MIKWFKILRWPTGREYLRRWMLTPEIGGRKWPWRLYLHNIVRPDAGRAPHDHPAWFVTLILRGGYTELEYDRNGTFVRAVRRGPGFVFRRATYVHRIISVRPNTWTLSLWGRYSRQWGFWPSPGVFIPDAEYPRTPEQMQ